MNRKFVMLSVVAVFAVLGFCNPFAESVRACDDCNCRDGVCCDGGCCDDGGNFCGNGFCDVPVVALTYPEPYNGENIKRGGLAIKIGPVWPPRPIPYRPRFVPGRPVPPPRPVAPPPRRWAPVPPPRW